MWFHKIPACLGIIWSISHVCSIIWHIFGPTPYNFKISNVLDWSNVSYAFFKSRKKRKRGFTFLFIFVALIHNFNSDIAVVVPCLRQNPCTASWYDILSFILVLIIPDIKGFLGNTFLLSHVFVTLIFGFDRVSFFSAASVPVHMVFMPPAVIVQKIVCRTSIWLKAQWHWSTGTEVASYDRIKACYCNNKNACNAW